MPMAYIDASLSQSGHRLFSAYQLLDEANRTYNPLTSGFQKIKNPRKQHTDFREENIEILLKDPAGDLERAEVLRELRAARRVKAKAEARRQAELVAQLKEEENKAKAKAKREANKAAREAAEAGGLPAKLRKMSTGSKRR